MTKKCLKCNADVKESPHNQFTGFKSFRCSNINCNSLFDISDFNNLKMEIENNYEELKDNACSENSYVYHVANPEIPGIIVSNHVNNTSQHCFVIFEEEVGFSGNAFRISKEWLSSRNLLFKSSEEAWKNKKW